MFSRAIMPLNGVVGVGGLTFLMVIRIDGDTCPYVYRGALLLCFDDYDECIIHRERASSAGAALLHHPCVGGNDAVRRAQIVRS